MTKENIYNIIDFYESDSEYHDFLFGLISMISIDDHTVFRKLIKKAIRENKRIIIKEPDHDNWDSLLISNIEISDES